MHQPLTRDTQIELMRDAEKRHQSILESLLKVPMIQEEAKRCAFEENSYLFSQTRMRVAR